MSSTSLTLYDHPVSSYAQKIRIALREKSIPFTPILPSTFAGRPDPSYQKANPRLEVPTLLDGNVEIFDSTIILEYIEERWPEPALLPSLTNRKNTNEEQVQKICAVRAKARMIEDMCDTTYEALNWGYGEILWMGRADHNIPLKEKLTREAALQTVEIQAWLEDKLGTYDYFGGESGFGWADICVAPIVNRSAYFGFGPKEGSKLGRWLERVRGRDSIKMTFKEFEIAAGKMSDMKGPFERGERKREYRDARLEWLVKSGGIEIVQRGLEKGNIRLVLFERCG